MRRLVSSAVVVLLALMALGVSVVSAAPPPTVGICHATDSSTNPWVFMKVSQSAVADHQGHGDIIGVSSLADCTQPPPVNLAPDAVNDTASTAYQTPVTVTVLANDTDPDGDSLTITAVDAMSVGGGTVVLNADQTITYTPATGFSGTDTFTYTVSDGHGGTDTATVTVTVEAQQCGAISGEITDASTGAIISGATVTVDGQTTTTDASGDYSFACVTPGSQTVGASATGYANGSTTTTVVAGSTATNVNISLVPEAECVTYIVLNWGSTPSDLDSHLSGPDTSGGTFHLSYLNQNPVPYASLDVDDTTSFGPETVTVIKVASGDYVAGTYSYWVHDFTSWVNELPHQFATSQATVTVSQCGVQLAQFQVDDVSNLATASSDAYVWHVFTFTLQADGTMVITPVQELKTGSNTTVY